MNVLCTICSDLVNQAENLYVTKCGHIFHQHCLTQWIERSKTCPQCRNKLTDKCMFRLYPTVSNESNSEDAATLQSRLDDAQLQLRQQRAKYKEKEDKLSVATADLKRQDDLLKSYEKRLVSFDSKVLALREQLEIINTQNMGLHKVKEENMALKMNMMTLNGLQKVLNATQDDVEQILQSYTDLRTIATFATALKRALCDSEAKKNEARDRLHSARQELALERKNVGELQSRVSKLEDDLAAAEKKYYTLKKKGAAKPTSPTRTPTHSVERPRDVTDRNNSSFNGLVRSIVETDSPYLSLRQGNALSLAALQRAPLKLPEKPQKTEHYYLNIVTKAYDERNASKNPSSIFHKKEALKMDVGKDNITSVMDISYDGLGGHSKPDVFPVPNNTAQTRIPKLSAKHKLKRPNPTGSQDIEKMLKKVKNE